MSTERFVLRVWLPDRPGALGAVASRIGAVGGDVTGIEIVDRGEGAAVDELAVRLPSGQLDLALREIAAVDGARVESARPLSHDQPDPRLATLDAARELAAATSAPALAATVGRHARALVAADWAVVLTGQGDVLATEGDSPETDWVAALAHGTSGLPNGTVGGGAEEEVVAVHLSAVAVVLVVGRAVTPLRRREAQIIESLAGLADLRWQELGVDRLA